MNGPDDLQLEPLLPPEGQMSASADLEIEAALREVLAPETPPPGFVDRVMAAAYAPASQEGPHRSGPHRDGTRLLQYWRQPRLWATGAIAAALVLGALEGGLAWQRVREQQRRIREATQQFQTSERITLHALAQAREQLERAGVPLTLD